MVIIFHVLAALASIGYTTYLFISPAKSKFYVAYGLIGLTFASGTYLVITTHSNLLHSCEAGLLYLFVVLFGIATARHKLAHEKNKYK